MNNYSRFLFFTFYLTCLFNPVYAQVNDSDSLLEQSNKNLIAKRIETIPDIDGNLNDEVWLTAPKISEFYQKQPDTGDPISQPTDVYICYDDKHLYFGFKCLDDPEKITAKELKRDISLGEDDRVQIILDTFLDKRNAFWFQIGPRGSIGDALISENGAGFNKQWDGLFEGKAKITDFGWTAEMAIPFKTLNFRPDQTTWGLKVIRHIKRRLETSVWPVANLNTYTFQVSDAGLLTGLNNISQGFGVDIRPYGLIGFDQKKNESNEFVLNFGGDVFYQVSSGLNAALTINTDFAQTEVDSRQINLTRFALFFPEKRGFFLDGANYFNFGFNGDQQNRYSRNMIPFFSRRIGLDDDGNPIPIIAGLKIAGQAGNWNIGALNLTDKTDSSYRNFSVARISYNIGKLSYIGMLGTKGDAIGAEGNWLIGTDFKLATSTFKGNKNLNFTGFFLKSNTNNLIGKDISFGVDVSYPNDFLNLRIGHQEIGENYRAGIGFIPRLGIRQTYASAFLGPRPNKYGILKINSGAMIDIITDMQNELLTRDAFLKIIEFEFKSGEKAEYSLTNTYEYLNEDFEIYPKDSIIIPGGTYKFWRQGVELSTAARRNLWVETDFSWGDFFNGTKTTLLIKTGWKIGIPFFVGLEYELNNVNLEGGSFNTKVYRFNGDIYFNPDISLTNFIQYDNLSDNLGWQSRFRWIIKPGNEIILVYNSLMESNIERDVLIMAQNSFRFKVNYNIRF